MDSRDAGWEAAPGPGSSLREAAGGSSAGGGFGVRESAARAETSLRGPPERSSSALELLLLSLIIGTALSWRAGAFFSTDFLG